MIFTLFYWQLAAVLFSHTKSAPATSHQPPTSQHYFSLIVNQHQPPATASRTERLPTRNHTISEKVEGVYMAPTSRNWWLCTHF